MSTAEKFWDFSIRTYSGEGVPEACLAMQNTHGADVNVLLFCCWLGATRGEFETDTYAAVLAFTNTWADKVVHPLRTARTWMKTTGEQDDLRPGTQYHELREGIKSTELKAEHLQQTVMQSMVEPYPLVKLNSEQQVEAAVLNLYHYCSTQDIDWDDHVLEHLAVILRAAIPPGRSGVAAKLAGLHIAKPANPDLRREKP